MSEYNLFAQWLRERRKACGLTQADLAERTSLSFSAVQKLEAGQRKPSQQVAESLMAALRIPRNERARFLRMARGMPDGAAEQAAPTSNLPAQLTSLIGRDDALEEITALLKPDGEDQVLRL